MTHFDTRARPPFASLRGVHHRYGATRALDGVDLDIHAGEVVALLGANGAGKTTALGLMTGRITPTRGQALLFGGDPRSPAQRRGIGVMLQEASLADTLRVAEHVRLYSSYYPHARALDETLSLAGIADLANRNYGELSGGQQRRVQFALAICGRAPLIFVDEPSAGLDVESRHGLWEVLRRLRAAGTSIVLTTHYLEEADALADRVVVLLQGRVIAQDTPAGIKSRVAGKQVRAQSQLAAELVASWPEAAQVTAQDGWLLVRSHAPEALLRRWLALDPGLCELEVKPLSLEEAFLSLTAAHQAQPLEQAA